MKLIINTYYFMGNFKLKPKTVTLSRKEVKRIEKTIADLNHENAMLSAMCDESQLSTFKIIDALANVLEIDVDRTYGASKENNFNRFEIEITPTGVKLKTLLNKEN